MEFSEVWSGESAEKIKEKRTEVVSSIDNNLNLKVENAKKLAPFLIEKIREGKRYITLFSAFLVLGSAPKALSQDLGKPFLKEDPIVKNLDSAPIDSLSDVLDKYKLKIADFRPEASMYWKVTNIKSNDGRKIVENESGAVPDTTSDLGDLAVLTSGKSIEREIQNDIGGKGYSEDESIFEQNIDIAHVGGFDSAKHFDKISASELGRSKKEAVMNAVCSLSREESMYVMSGESALEMGDKHNLDRLATSVMAVNSFNKLYRVKVVSVERGDHSGDIYYRANVEAEIETQK